MAIMIFHILIDNDWRSSRFLMSIILVVKINCEVYWSYELNHFSTEWIIFIWMLGGSWTKNTFIILYSWLSFVWQKINLYHIFLIYLFFEIIFPVSFIINLIILFWSAKLICNIFNIYRIFDFRKLFISKINLIASIIHFFNLGHI